MFYQCQDCGREWTEGVAVEDLADVVTSDEIIEVHRLLEQDNKTLSEMTD